MDMCWSYPTQTKDSFGGKKAPKSSNGHGFWLGLTPPPNPFIGVYASKALFLFLVAKFHTSRTTTKGSIANGTKDSFAKEKEKLQSHYWLRFLAWANTTSLRRYLLVFFLVAKFYTSATTITKKTHWKGYKGFFWGKKKAPKSPYFERKKRFEIVIFRWYIYSSYGSSKQTRILFFFLITFLFDH